MIAVTVLGAINWDINLFVKRFPEVGEEVAVERITRVPGGKAANVAVAAARILGSGRAAVVGCLGRDEIAEAQIRILEQEGIVTSGVKILENEESGQAYILVDKDGRNIINTFFGSNLRLTPEDMRTPKIYSLLRNTSIITVIDPRLETIEEAVSIGKDERKTVVWDAGVRSTLGIDRLKEVLENIDYLVINQVEIRNLTGENDPAVARDAISKINDQIILVGKLGERGCLMIGPHEVIRVKPIDLKSLGMKVVNTVGCGDAFLGVFTASKAEGFDDRDALERANLAGAIKATKPETRGSPLRPDLEKYLEFRERGEVTSRALNTPVNPRTGTYLS